MAYVERGVIKPKRSLWRLSTYIYFFWSIYNVISDFIVTMFSKEKTDQYKKGSSSSNKWGGSGGGGGGGGGGGSGGGGRRPHGMADLKERDHNAAPACGSCCGG